MTISVDDALLSLIGERSRGEYEAHAQSARTELSKLSTIAFEVEGATSQLWCYSVSLYLAFDKSCLPVHQHLLS